MANKDMTATEKMQQKFADKTLGAEQLDGVAGGSTQQCKDDIAFLRSLLTEPVDDQIHTSGYDQLNLAMTAKEGWKKVGVRCEAFIKNNQNKYFIGVGEVSRQEAMEYAKRIVAMRNRK